MEWRTDPRVTRLAPGEIRVWVVDLDVSSDAEIDEGGVMPYTERAVLSPDEQTRADRFVRPRDRRRFVRCRAALREILGQLLAVRPSCVRFRAAGHGKPELDWTALGGAFTRWQTALQFNVSHSAGLALIAVTFGRPLGVDVEQVRPISEAERIVQSYYTPNELAAFRALADEDRPLAFMRGWTRKEAILKGIGIGLAGLATQHETWFGTGDLPEQFAPATPLARVGDWHLWDAAPRPGYVAALAIFTVAPERNALDRDIEASRA
jgi:4'-phosphopantetheinyl transferase